MVVDDVEEVFSANEVFRLVVLLVDDGTGGGWNVVNPCTGLFSEVEGFSGVVTKFSPDVNAVMGCTGGFVVFPNEEVNVLLVVDTGGSAAVLLLLLFSILITGLRFTVLLPPCIPLGLAIKFNTLDCNSGDIKCKFCFNISGGGNNTND